MTLFPLQGDTINTMCFWLQNDFALRNYPREILRKIPSKWIIFTVLCYKHVLRSKQGSLQVLGLGRAQSPLSTCLWRLPAAPGRSRCWQTFGTSIEPRRHTLNLIEELLTTYGAIGKNRSIFLTQTPDNGPATCICTMDLGQAC